MKNVLYINKPVGITSFDVCYKLRKILNTKRIGHTGTLDPNASGVMVVLANDACKAAQFLVSDRKTYRTRVLYGIETDTLDVQGKIINESSYIAYSKQEIADVLNTFLGKSKQVVPLTSAKQINGKRLYQYQRENIDVELPIIDIEIFSIELNEVFEDGFSFTCEVSSGTYIRSLCKDILSRLNTIGTVKELTRIAIDDIQVEDCDDLNDILNGNYTNHNLLDLLKKRYKTIELDNIDDIKNGKRIKLDCNDKRVLIVNNNEAIAIYEYDNGLYKSVRGLW